MKPMKAKPRKHSPDQKVSILRQHLLDQRPVHRQMRLDQQTMYIVNSVPGVIKFVGAGEEPQPLKPEEMNKILGIADELEVAAVVGKRIGSDVDHPHDQGAGRIQEG